MIHCKYHYGTLDKHSLELNNSLVNPRGLATFNLLCKNSRATHLAQPCLIIGWQADDTQVRFENLNICYS